MNIQLEIKRINFVRFFLSSALWFLYFHIPLQQINFLEY